MNKIREEKGCGIGPEYPRSHLIELSFIIAFISSWLLDLFILKFNMPFGFFIIDIIRLVGFTISISTSLILIKLSGRVLSSEIINETRLLKEGIYAYTRNPMYFGIFLIYTAFTFLTMSLPCLICLVIIAIMFNKMVNYEENALKEIFDERYLVYLKTIPKWIPNILRLISRKVTWQD